jgi:hypothetical protein
MATTGSALRVEGNVTLRTTCAEHAHPLDETFRRETWGLVGLLAANKTVFATCDACHQKGWRPPGFAGIG